MKTPVKVEVHTKLLQSFKEFIKDQKKDEEVKINKKVKELILLPRYDKNLKAGEFYFPQTLLPIFPEEEMGDLKTYECKINTELDKLQDLADLVYYLECNFFLTALDTLVSSDGESKNIMKIIIKEVLNYHLFDCYTASDSILVINSGVVIKFSRKNLCAILRRMLIKFRDIEESIYHSDQLVSICTKILAIMGSNETDYSYSIDDVEDSELYESLQRNKKSYLHGDSECLHIRIVLASKKDRSKTQAYKVIDSIDEIQIQENLNIEFKSHKDIHNKQEVSFEANLFKQLYTEEIITPIKEHYSTLLSEQIVEKNYMMLYGQKGTGKTFFVLHILPKLFPDVDIEYIDMNRMLLLSNNFNDMDMAIKYLSAIFMQQSDSNIKKIYVVDHVDCALPKSDPNEIIVASKRIKQIQLLMFFLDLIDSKKYCLLFLGRHFQNCNTELAGVSRIDKFVHINPPDFKKRKTAFNHIIKMRYKPKLFSEICSSDFGGVSRETQELKSQQQLERI